MKDRRKGSRKLFGTDGIRGVANLYPMTAEIGLQLGRALTTLMRGRHQEPRFIIGKDTRLSGYMLESSLVAGITSMGGFAYLLGPLPTPAVAYLIRSMRAQGGVMISASHNPYQDNGLKVFGGDGFKLDDALESQMESWILAEDEVSAVVVDSDRLGRAQRIDDAEGRYLTQLKTIFRKDFDLLGWKIVFDAANGAAYNVGVTLFKELGAEVIQQACAPNGLNINKACAQENVKLLQEKVRESKADIGIAVDGDADRLLICDEQGIVISGEHLMYHLALFLKETSRLGRNGTMVTTSMSNQAMANALESESVSVVRTQVGDRYVTETLRDQGLNFGGENSGHFLFLDQNTTADGLFSALEILALLHRKKQKASYLRSGFDLYPQKLVSLKVKEKKPLDEMPQIQKAIQEVESKYQGNGRVNIRYSGTEPLLRIMLEGPELISLEKDMADLTKLLSRALG